MSKITLNLECNDIDTALYTLMFHGLMNDAPNYEGGFTLKDLGSALGFLSDCVDEVIDDDSRSFYDVVNEMILFKFSDEDWLIIEKFINLNRLDYWEKKEKEKNG